MPRLRKPEERVEKAFLGELGEVPPPPAELVQLEEAVFGYVTNREPPSREELARVLVDDDHEEREARLAIYRDGYLARLINALRNDFPHVAQFLSPVFADVVDLYVRHHPSTFYNITRMRDGFPGFLKKVTGLNHLSFAVALAQIDLAIGEVGDGEEIEPLSADAWAALALRDWANLALIPVPTMRLVALHHPVENYLQSPEPEPDPTWLERSDCWMVLYRRHYEVWRMSLERREYALLRLLHKGLALEPSLKMTCGADFRAESRLTESLPRWFEAGLFHRVEGV